MSEPKELTVMFYFASDNPLASSTVSQLKAIKDAGFHPDANVIARFDPRTEGTPSHIFDVNLINKLKSPGEVNIGFAEDTFVKNLVADKLWGDSGIRKGIQKFLNQDRNGGNHKIYYDPPKPTPEMSDEQSPLDALTGFLDFCRENYPAHHYILFILGHGIVVGNDLFLFDEHAPQHSLLLKDLGELLRKFKNDIQDDDHPGEFDLVGFHSCSMSGLEVAYELRGSANYMLASQGPAYVGSWPYRQILIRLFKELNSFSRNNLINAAGLINKLKTGTDQVSNYVRDRFADQTRELVTRSNGTQQSHSVLHAVVSELNNLLDDPALYQAAQSQRTRLSKGTQQLVKQHQNRPLCGTDLRRLNRHLLAEAYPEEIANINLKKVFTKIFYYCLYNSYDFQLAGLSFDLCLCDLTKVREVKDPLNDFSSALIAGLELSDPLPRQLMVLAHWEAQSYYKENYTDLYDFCFRLNYICRNAQPGSKKTAERLESIWQACEKVMNVLQRGVEGNDDKLVVRSEFAGPAFQYSHGLSVFFPWSEPVASPMWDDQYAQYKMNKKTAWRDFLQEYFADTMRQPHLAERDSLDIRVEKPNLDAELLNLLQQIATRTFNTDGQLAKGGPEDRTDEGTVKAGPHDPTGDDCGCPSFKNHPHFTRARGGKNAEEKLPVSPNFFAALK